VGIAAHAEALERFLHDTRAQALISHLNVARGDEVGDEHGVYYVAMEYVPMSLGTILEHQDKLEWQQARIITRQVAAALRAAVRGGIPTHLDLKPQNVLLSKEGVVKVTDFGAVGAAPRGQTLGSPQYMSPEQA
jgi:serine/threonine protein kinase